MGNFIATHFKQDKTEPGDIGPTAGRIKRQNRIKADHASEQGAAQ